MLKPAPSYRNVLLTGNTGVGKSVIAVDFLRTVLNTDNPHGQYSSNVINFSAQTSSHYLQDVMETKLEKKGKTLGGPGGKHMIFVIDDINMPELEQYGAQPPIELLRQTIDQGGFYDRLKLFFKKIKTTSFMAACGPPGGGRNPTSKRLLRQFHILNVPEQDRDGLTHIFETILGGFLTTGGFAPEVCTLSHALVEASVQVYTRISAEMLPTPSKMHYTFNLRDLSKVMQGMLQTKPALTSSPDMLVRLWAHETARVFRDRLINLDDRHWFIKLQQELLGSLLSRHWEPSGFAQDMFGGFMDRDDETREYRYVPEDATLLNTLEEYVEEFNLTTNSNTKLVFFGDAIRHLARISRVLCQPRGNAVLVGVGGSGRQVLTRLAAFISNAQTIQPEITRTYGKVDFREDVKRALLTAGCGGKHVVFLLSDNQIVREDFLEDINCVLNTGEVPNVFGPEDYERIMADVTPLARAAGKLESKDVVYAHFVELVREVRVWWLCFLHLQILTVHVSASASMLCWP